MGLFFNGYRHNGRTRIIGATNTDGYNPYITQTWKSAPGRQRCITLSDGMDNGGYVSVPDGRSPEYSWVMPQKAGRVSSRNEITGGGTLSATLLSVRLMEAAFDGEGELTAFGGLVVQMLAGITGSGTISNADAKAFLAMVAAFTGSGALAATATGFAELITNLTGSGTLDDSVISGIAELTADLVVTGAGLTTANVGGAVWSALAALNNAAGTMGEKLNDAGSAANPWTEVIESGYSAADILRLLAAVAAGKTNIDSGAETTVTFRNLADSKDRVSAEMEGSERVSVTLDLT